MNSIALYQISLKVFIKNAKWEILALKTPAGSGFHGKYDFPWGRINEDEFSVNLKDILKREIQEEVGNIRYSLSEKPVAYARHKGISHFVFYVFWEATLEENVAIQISHEHENFQWLDCSNIHLEEYFESGMLEGIKIYLGK